MYREYFDTAEELREAISDVEDVGGEVLDQGYEPAPCNCFYLVYRI